MARAKVSRNTFMFGGESTRESMAMAMLSSTSQLASQEHPKASDWRMEQFSVEYLPEPASAQEHYPSQTTAVFSERTRRSSPRPRSRARRGSARRDTPKPRTGGWSNSVEV